MIMGGRGLNLGSTKLNEDRTAVYSDFPIGSAARYSDQLVFMTGKAG